MRNLDLLERFSFVAFCRENTACLCWSGSLHALETGSLSPKVRDQAQRSSRILLDIEAAAPVLLIPESSRSNHLIVANLGKLKVKNRFLFSGTPGTFSLKDKVRLKRSSFLVLALFLGVAAELSN